MTPKFDVLIVGGGHGGAQTAIALRQQGFDGTIAIVSEERELPYERPPLSKDYLAREKPFERIMIRPAAFWNDRDIVMLLGQCIVAVDGAAHTVTTADGTAFGYDKLVWATGGKPRKLALPGHDLAGVHSVRARSDVDRIMAELEDVTRVVVFGGGFIGLEAAAVLTKLGKQVILLEAMPRILARVAGSALSQFFEAEHRAHGVDIRLEAMAESILESSGRVAAVRLTDGEILECEMVIVGIGIEPAVVPLLKAGAVGSNGVHVDSQCRTSLADIFAIGDCAAHDNRFAVQAHIRLESVQNANDQAMTVARTITGAHQPYDALPWFWSTQYDLKLQTVGLSSGHDLAVLRGDPQTRSFSVIYLKEGRVIALDCVNAMKDYVQGRGLVMGDRAVPVAQLADPTIPLKDLASAAADQPTGVHP